MAFTVTDQFAPVYHMQAQNMDPFRLFFLSFHFLLTNCCQLILNNKDLQESFDDIDDVIAEIYRGDVADINEVFISRDGDKVDYLELADNWIFDKYVDDCSLLSQMRPEKLSEKTRKKFFINVYNFLTIHAVIDYAQKIGRLPNKTQSIPRFLTDYCYNIGGLLFHN